MYIFPVLWISVMIIYGKSCVDFNKLTTKCMNQFGRICEFQREINVQGHFVACRCIKLQVTLVELYVSK